MGLAAISLPTGAIVTPDIRDAVLAAGLPRLYLFPGRDEDRPIDPTVLHAAGRSAARIAAILRRHGQDVNKHRSGTPPLRG